MGMDRKEWTTPDLAIEWTDLFYFFTFLFFLIFELDCLISFVPEGGESHP